MAKTVDARGLTCPQPVILTRKAMEESGKETIVTLVDNRAALENVSRLGSSQGYQVSVAEKDGIYEITLTPSDTCCAAVGTEQNDLAIMVRSSLFGQGNDELGQVLMKSFVYALSELPNPIKHMIFMNSGVFLTTEGSPIIEQLRLLESCGTEILSCGTCLDFYGLKDKLEVGKVTNMYTALEIMSQAGKSLIF